MQTQNPYASPATSSPDRPTAVRYFMLLLLSFAPALAYLTRTPAAMATTIQQEFSLDNETLGSILAGFSLGYFLFQVPGGWFANWCGVRVALPTIGVAWSSCALWGSLARSPAELHAARFALGLAQAGLVPCCARALREWFPDRERGVASAAIAMSMQIGGAAAIGVTGVLIPFAGWRGLLMAYSAVGLAWVAWFAWAFRNRPADHRRVNAGELAAIGSLQADQPSAATVAPASPGPRWRVMLLMLSSLSMWAVCAQSFFRAFAYEFFSTWFPAYLEKARRVSLQESSMQGMLPIVAIGLGSLLGGVVIDVLFRRTGSKWISRSGTAVFALASCAAMVGAAAFVKNTNVAVGIIAVGQLLAALAASATWAATLDISGRHTALVFGVMNAIGSLGSYACPEVVGRLADHIERTNGDWNLVLYLFVGINLAGAICWLALNPNRSAVERG